MKGKISDNEAIQDIEKQLKSAQLLKKITYLFGMKIDEDFDLLEEKILELKHLPDRFNQIFSSKGWIAHDSLDVNVMKRCIELEDKGEALLVDYYENKLDWFINILLYKPIFRERAELLILVKEDYVNERYHSCIPIVLMLVDGIVNDIKDTGLFADNTDLDVWDSISGHSTGLKSLVGILKKSRKKTNTDPIELPYRNGILHGRDLNYNNKKVAIKTFAILFYVYDWMISLESEEIRKQKYLEEKKRNEETNIFDVIKKFREIKKKSKRINRLSKEWQPRNFDEIEIEIEEGTPEAVSIMFLEYIKNKNYGSPVSFYFNMIYDNVSIKEKAGLFRKEYGNLMIDKYYISKIEEISEALTHVYVVVDYKVDGISDRKELDFRMIYELDGEIENRLVDGGSWKIVNIEGLINQFKI